MLLLRRLLLLLCRQLLNQLLPLQLRIVGLVRLHLRLRDLQSHALAHGSGGHGGDSGGPSHPAALRRGSQRRLLLSLLLLLQELLLPQLLLDLLLLLLLLLRGARL